jgi:WD40 repeat protein
VVAGTAQYVSGPKERAHIRKCIIRNGCKGVSCFIFQAGMYSSVIKRVTSSIFSADARFALTGSDDGNVRIWKVKAAERLGIVTARERAAIEYRNSLKERWKMDAEVGKVSRCVHNP